MHYRSQAADGGRHRKQVTERARLWPFSNSESSVHAGPQLRSNEPEAFGRSCDVAAPPVF